jgi:predicted permease
MPVLINVIMPVFLVVLVSTLAQIRLGLDVRTLSRAAFYLFSPALVFDALTTSDISGGELGQITAVVLLMTAVMWLIGEGAARLMHLPAPTASAFLVCILIMNAGNYGISVNLFAFGEPGLARATIYFTLSAVLASSLGVFVSARGRASTGLALRRVIRVPLAYAALLGVICSLGNLVVPGPLAKAIHLLGQASVPLMLVVLGLRLAQVVQSRQRLYHLPALGVATLLRLLVAPALAWVLAGAVGMSGLARDVTVLESAMPTAVMSTILATEFDSDPSFAALVVLVTTLLSLPTLTVLLNLLI